jgi:hypothetical protein
MLCRQAIRNPCKPIAAIDKLTHIRASQAGSRGAGLRSDQNDFDPAFPSKIVVWKAGQVDMIRV